MAKGYVYIVTNDTYESKDMYKVGRTKNIKTRFSNFQTFSPDLLKIIYVHECENMEVLEKQFQKLMKAFDTQIRNEWYLLKIDQIKALISFASSSMMGKDVTQEVTQFLRGNKRKINVQDGAITIREFKKLSNLSGTFYLRSRKNAVLQISNGEIVLKKGAVARKNTTSTLEDGTFRRVIDKRVELITSGSLVDNGIEYVLTKDEPFTNVSMAANVLLGRWANGRDVWVDANGRSINDIIREEQ